ncbi:MAG: metallopeptidase TldD-related protein [Candidatus Kapabacteria bacterium]|jgi:predicted Zn-dependent protease|nr:metallopeptidase TldD-related protein [Candidatus Kapabacteria bacterium]
MKNMIRNILLLVLTISIFGGIQDASAQKRDDIISAMRDEISRSMKELKLESLERPYYVEYKVEFKESSYISATLGSLVNSETTKTANVTVGIRVGNYKTDNTNFFDFSLSFFGSGDDEERFKGRRISPEADYESLRRQLWLATDAAYKQAAELYSKKTATMKNRMRKDTTHDFLRVPAEKKGFIGKFTDFGIKKHENLLRDLSAIFKDFKDIDASGLSMEYLPKTVYYVNSEGMEYVKQSSMTGLEAVAFTQNDDGMPLANYFQILRNGPSDLPTNSELIASVRHMAQELSDLNKAPVLDEPYSGPLIFADEASAQIMAQMFAPNLATQRMPMTEGGVQQSDRFTAFQSKIGGRVLPEFMSVDAKPQETTFMGTKLVGSSVFDDDGVDSENVTLVKNGYLKTLLSSRVPTRRVRKSNGHRRGGAPMLSNIFVSADVKHSKSKKELSERMMKLCKDRELPYGLIVRKLTDLNVMYTSLYRISGGNLNIPRGNGKFSPIMVYKVYPDGKEELVRGLQGSGFTVQSFKDIILVSHNEYILNYWAPSVTSPYVSGGDQYINTTIISPDLLFEDGEMRLIEDDFKKPPLIANPLGE